MKKRNGLIIAGLLAIILAEFGIREALTRQTLAKLQAETDNAAKRELVQNLATGCPHTEAHTVIPHYVIERVFGPCRPFIQTQLANVDLSELNLSGATFTSANLSGANFYNASLVGTTLDQSNLRDASLSFTQLEDASLQNVALINATLNYVSASNTDFSNADFSGAHLTQVTLWKSNFTHASFTNAYVHESSLLQAQLDEANLSNATFSGVHLGSASLNNTNLSNTLFLSTLLRPIETLTQGQLETENPPLICNSPLPKAFNMQVGEHRDCENWPQVLQQRHPKEFASSEAAQTYFEALICDSFVSRNVDMAAYEPVNCEA